MPDDTVPSARAAADLAECRAALRTGSRSFHAAARLLPRRVMAPATALYAFCRDADDRIDLSGSPAAASGSPAAALEALHHRLDRIYANTPGPAACDRALAAVVSTHRIPRSLLDGLLEGFQWDAEGRRYDDLAALHAYAARVAGTVGAAMAALMGVRDPEIIARACDLGIAMQLSNIARDVGEDARAGRLYLPTRWLHEVGIDPATFLAAPRFTPALGQVVIRLVRSADTLYARADAGIAALPLDCRPGIGAARRLYAAIGHRVLAAHGNSIDARAVVPGPAKLAIVLTAAATTLRPRSTANGAFTAAPPIPAARNFVMAVAASAPPPPPSRLVWLIELFAALHHRQTGTSAQRSQA